jgi:hypothetical protein
MFNPDLSYKLECLMKGQQPKVKVKKPVEVQKKPKPAMRQVFDGSKKTC